MKNKKVQQIRQKQITSSTESDFILRKGLKKFRNQYKDHLYHDKNNASKEAIFFFEAHDVAHVLFGCDISLYGEGSVKIWTIFGTTLGFWKHIKGYKEANAFELSRDFTLSHIVKNIFKLLFAIPRIIYRAKQMTKPWNWVGFEQYLDRPIEEIREEFNIKILK